MPGTKTVSAGSLTQGPLFKSFIRYAIPLILTGILQLLFNTADMIVVGQFCGSLSVAAVGSTGAIISLITTLFMGLSTGVGVSVAHAVGAGEKSQVHRVVHTAIPVALISGAMLMALGLWTSMRLLRLIDTPEDVIEGAAVYIRIYYFGMIPMMVYNFGAELLRSTGDTKSPLKYLLIAGTANVILNVIFVVLFHMDVAGVALATAITQGLSAVLILRALICRRDNIQFHPKQMCLHLKTSLKILRIGVPASFEGLLYAIANLIIQSAINSFGSTAVSGTTASTNVESFVYIIVMAISQSVLVFTGQNYGARNIDRLKKLLRMELVLASVCAEVFGLLAISFGEPLLSIYIPDSPDAIEFGMQRLRCFMIPYALFGLLNVIINTLRGLDFSMAPTLVSVLGICGVRLGWVWLVFSLPSMHTVQGLCLCYPVSFAVTSLGGFLVYFLLWPRRKKKLLAG